MFILLTGSLSVLHAQNIIQNPGFSTFTCASPSCPITPIGNYPAAGNVPNWYAQTGTPDIYPGSKVAFMWDDAAAATSNESVVQVLSAALQADSFYLFKLSASQNDFRGSGGMIVELTNNAGVVQQTIITTAVTNTSMITYSASFKATAASTRILVRANATTNVMDLIIDNLDLQKFTGKPDFSFSAPGFCPGLTVSFSDLSNLYPLTVTSWDWDFGNGNTSTAANPTQTYSTAGTYPVSLTVTLSNGSTQTVVKNVTINPKPSIIVNSSGPYCEGSPVSFTSITSISSGSISSWAWIFGDSSTSALDNPVHTYTTAGTYSITLSVTSAAGCTASLNIPAGVVINPRPVANFVFPALNYTNDAVSFTDSSTISSGTISAWLWNFEGTDTSTFQNPEFTFTTAGTKPVKLTVISAAGCTKDITKNITITDPPTGIAEHTKNRYLMAYPNPFARSFTIPFTYAANWNTEVFDIAGRLVFSNTSGTPIDQLTIPAAEWKAGVYHVTTTDNQGERFSFKMVKMKE